MEEALLADPCAATDGHTAKMMSLQDSIVPDINMVTDLDSIRMKHQHAGFDNHAVAQMTELGTVDLAGAMRCTHREASRVIHGRQIPLPLQASQKRRDTCFLLRLGH